MQRALGLLIAAAAACVPASTRPVDAGAIADAGANDPDAGGGDAGAIFCDDADRPARVLMIGNSYTDVNGGLDALLVAMAAQHACAWSMTAARYAPGGRTFATHAADAETIGNMLYELLRDPLGWDVVMLQDQSQIAGFGDDNPDTTASRDALTTILVPRAEASGARVVLLMTWGYLDGDPLNGDVYPDYETMQAALAAGYEAYRDDAAGVAMRPVVVAPAGLAFDRVHDGADAGERFPSLYSADGKHPSALGSYLAAATLFATITGLDPAATSTGAPLDLAEKSWLDVAARAAASDGDAP